jgi:sulfotransferase family protein
MLDDLDIDAAYTHDGSGYEDHISIEMLNPDKAKYAAAPVLLVIRDPRDIVVSGYFQVLRRLRIESAASMSMATFVRDKHYGIEKVIHFYLQWFAAAPQMSRFAMTQYEDLRASTARTLLAVARFAGRESTAAVTAEVSSRRSLANMRKLEAKGNFAARYGNALVPSDSSDLDSYKVRRGVVGGYVDYLSGEDIDYCDHVLDNSNFFCQLRHALMQRTVLRYGAMMVPTGMIRSRIPSTFHATTRPAVLCGGCA